MQPPIKPVEPTFEEFGLTQAEHSRIKRRLDELAQPSGNFKWLAIIIFVACVIVGITTEYRWIIPFGMIFCSILYYHVFKWLAESITESKTQRIPKLDNYYRYGSAQYDYRSYTEKAEKAVRTQILEKERAEKRKQFDYWSTLDPYEFEKEIAELFNKMGFNATVTKGSGDGGIDILLKRADGKEGIVQCKRQQTKVSPSVIRDLYGTMVAGKYSYGYVVCPAGFSDSSNEFARGKKYTSYGVADDYRPSRKNIVFHGWEDDKP